MPDPNAVGPDGRTYAEITGTPYASDAERTWYLAQEGLGVDANGNVVPIDQSQTQPASVASSYGPVDQGQTAQQGQGFGVQPGYQWELLQRTQAFQAQQAQAQRDFQAAQNQINIAADAHQKEMDRQLQLQLQAGTISNEQYMQARQLAQQESEFARDLALRQLEEQHNFQMQQGNLELNALHEAGAQQLQQANLAANPQDLVAYEYFMRNMGSPTAIGPANQYQNVAQAAWDLAQRFANPNSPQASTAAAQSPGGTATAPTGGGQPYFAPGYTNQSLQNMLSGITGNLVGDGNGPNGVALYNPGMSGTGAFGATIPGPNQISRSTFQNMSPTDMGILESFLKGGVQMNGQLVGINPNDYFAQLQRSFIPTLAQGTTGAGTQYQTGTGGTQYLGTY